MVLISIFPDLLRMQFFQCSPLNFEEGKFVMHELLCDLVRSVSGDAFLRAEDYKLSSEISKDVRHLSFSPTVYDSVIQFEPFKELTGLDSLLVINSSPLRSVDSLFYVDNLASLSDLLSKSRCLRTLDLSYTNIKELPDSIEYLESLQFLGLNNTNIRKLPDSIWRLSNLQTLELRNCCCLCELPNGIKDLVKLRHLDVWKETGVIRTPLGIGRLTNLRTLGTFSVGELCKLSELKNLKRLRGHLRIGCLENVGRGIDARSAFLKDKWGLKKLTLQWNRGEEKLEGNERVTTAGEFLENIRPHESLEELIIRDYCGLKFPTWLANPFSELASVTLVNCYGCHELPKLGRLGNLQYLFMQNVNGLRHVASDLGGTNTCKFHSLKSLKLWEMYELEDWNDGEETVFPRLESLSISRCPRLRSLPSFISLNLTSLALPSTLDALETLEIQSCNKISSVDGLQLLKSLKKLKLKNCPELSFSQDARLPDALQVVDIHCSCSSLKNWCPYGFEDISGAHNQVSRKLVR
ncbi:putative disease resistance protein RGA4 isoform X2 [Typha latifolia]|uniref:putative disease resistance protein RGA4 isoform X2 n=1 Tax=Typha latifolia TaxID=4733 RepID=UPI003C2E0008